VDTLSRSQRSERMARVRAQDTKPEMIVRRAAHALGFRFRLHRKNLSGRPDLVFPQYGVAMFVHGCFWHQHDAPGCWRSRVPKSNTHFWVDKLTKNRIRDERNRNNLLALGWRVVILWECELAGKDQLRQRLCEAIQGESD